MASNQKALLVSLGIGVGVAAVVAGGVYYIVSTDERKTVIKASNPVCVEMRIPIKVIAWNIFEKFGASSNISVCSTLAL